MFCVPFLKAALYELIYVLHKDTLFYYPIGVNFLSYIPKLKWTKHFFENVEQDNDNLIVHSWPNKL